MAATRQAFAGYADRLLSNAATMGYPAPTLSYGWGSNGNVANNANVLGLAYDFTGQPKYRDGVYQSLDYLLGRNPLNRSYVAGYGENAPANVHHRFFARSLDSSLPPPPPGALAGGPNSDLQDPVARAQLAGCRPQRCYLDNIEAYSVNEVAINWNSALAWLTNWAAEKAGDEPGPSPSPSGPLPPTGSPSPSPSGPAGCRVAYSTNAWSAGFTATLTITNTGPAGWNGWTLRFALPVTTTIVQGWSGRFSRSGTAVTVTDAGWNGALAAGASTGVGFQASTSAPAPDPTTFTVNGTTCG